MIKILWIELIYCTFKKSLDHVKVTMEFLQLGYKNDFFKILF